MADVAFQVGRNVRGVFHEEEFVAVRKTAALEGFLHERGEEWVGRLNAELHAAQAKRRQPIEDGYVYHIHSGTTRLRLYIVAATARAQAHERAHSSILKLMETTNYDVKTRTQLAKSAAARKAAKTRRERRAAATASAAEFVAMHDDVRGIDTGMSVLRPSSPDDRGRF